MGQLDLEYLERLIQCLKRNDVAVFRHGDLEMSLLETGAPAYDTEEFTKQPTPPEPEQPSDYEIHKFFTNS